MNPAKLEFSDLVAVLETSLPVAKHIDLTEFYSFLLSILQIFHFAGPFLPMWSLGPGVMPPGPPETTTGVIYPLAILTT